MKRLAGWDTTLFNVLTDPILLFEMKEDGSPGKVIDVNKTACEKLGYTRDELLNLTFADIDRNRFEQIIDAEHNIKSEREFIAKNGSKVPVELTSRALDKYGVRYVLSIVRDLSVTKREEAEIIKLKSLPEENPSPVLSVGLDGRLLSANPASAPLLDTWKCKRGDLLPPVLIEAVSNVI
jgi:PAS domain S-box-containing protein